jgi:hypothetical protein
MYGECVFCGGEARWSGEEWDCLKCGAGKWVERGLLESGEWTAYSESKLVKCPPGLLFVASRTEVKLGIHPERAGTSFQG